MRILFLIVFFSTIVSSISFAQNKKLFISINSEQSGRATFLLYRLPDSVPFLKKNIDIKDQFELPTGLQYRIHISSIGTNDFDTAFKMQDSDIYLYVTLSRRISLLSDVKIISKKPLIKEEDDKTVVDAAALTISSTNALEVIEKTPGAIVDQDGNIYLNSTQPATVYINGREMKLSGADLASLMKSLPANSVNKIEILRTPSAKFDAASSGGIINIVLKKGVKLGSNGSFNVAYFQGVYATKTTGISFNHNTNKVNAYINYQYTNRTNYEDVFSKRAFLNDPTYISQSSFTKYPGNVHYVSLGLDYTINKKWNSSLDAKYSANKNNNVADNSITIVNRQNEAVVGENQSLIRNNNLSDYISNTLNVKCKIDSNGSEWNQSVQYEYYHNKNDQGYQNDFIFPVTRYTAGNGTSINQKNILSFQSDLIYKIKNNFTLETGVKFVYSNNQSAANYVKDTGNQMIIPDDYQTNTYKYNEKIGALYLQMSKSFWGFTLKPGLRLETTNIYGLQLIPKDTAFSIKRTDIFPYVFIKHQLFKIFGQPLIASLIFRKSIKRPYFESLNPYPKYVDQYLYDIGNPALIPQLTTNYECSVTFNDIPVAAIGVNQTKNIFSNVIYQDDVTKIAYRTFDNLGKNKEVYGRLIMGIPPGGKYFFYLGSLINFNEFEGYYQNQPFHYKRSTLTFFTFHEYKFNSKFTINLQGFLRSKALQNFYELNTFGGIFVSANKSLLKKKANVIISVNDLLHTNQVQFTYDRNNQTISGKRINDTRRVGLTLRYNFGVKPKEEKKVSLPTETENNN